MRLTAHRRTMKTGTCGGSGHFQRETAERVRKQCLTVAARERDENLAGHARPLQSNALVGSGTPDPFADMNGRLHTSIDNRQRLLSYLRRSIWRRAFCAARER